MSNRPPIRPVPPHESMSPRERAEARIAQLRDHDRDIADEGQDEFFIEPGIIPDGWSYEWKTRTILGLEDPAHQVALARKGWESVPASRHPELMPMGYTGAEITRKGMVLMERPLQITEEVRAAELRRARLQMRSKEEQLAQAGGGQFERSNKGENMVKVKKGYEAMPIPE